MAAKDDYPRINISITHELKEQLEEFRGVINISQTCREALWRRVETLRRGREEVKEKLGETIERLKKEKAKYEAGFYDSGFKDGYKDASTVSYTDLLYINEFDQFTGTCAYVNYRDDINEEQKGEILFETLPSWAKDNVIQSYQYPGLHSLNYINGWLDGVNAFYKEIKDKI